MPLVVCVSVLENDVQDNTPKYKITACSTEGSALWKYGLVELFFQKCLAKKNPVVEDLRTKKVKLLRIGWNRSCVAPDLSHISPRYNSQ